MEHVVFFPGADGSPAFRRTGSLEEAVRFVEHLRNVEGVTEVSVHALSPVPLAFRTYVKVELPPEELAALGELPVQPVVEPVVEPVADFPVEPVAEQVVEPVAEPVAEVAPEAVPVLAQDVVPDVRAEEPSLNGKRSLGFFAS